MLRKKKNQEYDCRSQEGERFKQLKGVTWYRKDKRKQRSDKSPLGLVVRGDGRAVPEEVQEQKSTCIRWTSGWEGKSQTQGMCTILLRERGWKLEGIGRGLVFSFLFDEKLPQNLTKTLIILTILNKYKEKIG